MTKEFYFIRHGETDWNTRQLCQGQFDIPLNALGREQAKAAGNRVRHLPIKSIVFSPLKRAAETATIIGQYIPDASLIPNEALMERAWGSYEGVASEKMYEYEETERTEGALCRNLGTGFETKEMFLKRIGRALQEVLELELPVLIVSHGRFFNAMCELLDIPPVKQVANGVPFTFREHEGQWQIVIVLEAVNELQL